MWLLVLDQQDQSPRFFTENVIGYTDWRVAAMAGFALGAVLVSNLADLLSRAPPPPDSPSGTAASHIRQFVSERASGPIAPDTPMKSGDAVLVLDPSTDRYVLGKVESAYERARLSRISHLRRVKWEREVDVAALPPDDARFLRKASASPGLHALKQDLVDRLKSLSFEVKDQRTSDFATVSRRERQIISRQGRSENLGIAFSGGGIRSAAYALGALQALHKTGVLGRAGYLSSVSGGGFAAAAFLSQGSAMFEAGDVAKSQSAENPVYRHIRRHASYLAPDGILSLDGLTFASTYFTGLASNVVQFFGLSGFVTTLAVACFLFAEPHMSRIVQALGLIILLAFLLMPFVRPRTAVPGGTVERAAFERRRLQRIWLAGIAVCGLFIGFLYVFQGAVHFLEQKPVEKLERAGALLAANLSVVTVVVRAVARGLSRRVSLSLAAQILGLALIGSTVAFVITLDLYLVDPSGATQGAEPPVFRFLHARWPAFPHGDPATFPHGDPAAYALLLLGWMLPAVCGMLIARFVSDVGSVHHVYRDRITETFITHPVPPEDTASATPRPDLLLKDAGVRDRDLGAMVSSPLPIINATVNMPASVTRGGERLRSEVFELTPVYVGSAATSYALTRQWNGGRFALCRAIAASGAAVSMQMGRYTQPLLSFLVSVLNLRLGVLVRNPGGGRLWDHPYVAGPFSDWRLWRLKETSSKAYLSDGGHVENLGLLSLLRRRCRYIVVVDAEQDAARAHEGLAVAQRLARNQLNALIDIDLSDLDIGPTGKVGAPCAVGRIKYLSGPAAKTSENDLDRSEAQTNGHPAKPEGSAVQKSGDEGWILYVKAGVAGTETVDVKNHARSHPEFPNDPTSNQFFDDAQFEAYRELGKQSIERVFERVTTDDGADSEQTNRFSRNSLLSDLDELFRQLHGAWRVRPNVPLEAFLRTTDRFMDIEYLLAEHDGVGVQYRKSLVTSEDAKPADVHVYLMQMQLMEQVYLACLLEKYHDHPENTGWVALFEAYVRNEGFKKVWNEAGQIFGENFRHYLRRRFKLPLPRVRSAPSAPALSPAPPQTVQR